PRDVDEPGALADQEKPRAVQPRGERVEPALRDRLRAPRDTLAAVEDLPHEAMRLELLEEIVGGELDVRVFEPDDEADRDVVVAHRVDERASELAIPRALAERPPHRVHDLPQWLRDAPHLFHPERPDLRVAALEPEGVDRGRRQMPRGPLGEDGELRGHVDPGLEVRQRLAVLAATL